MLIKKRQISEGKEIKKCPDLFDLGFQHYCNRRISTVFHKQ